MKRKLINSFIILSASSAISKIFSILNRMLLSRLLPLEAMSLYLVIMPTLSLCLTLGQVGIPSAVFRLILHPNYKNYKVIITAILLSFFSVIVICGTLFILSPFIAHSLLKNEYTLYPILSFLIFIPLIAISGIIKNYYLAKGHVYVIAKSQIVEETSRLLFTYLFLKNPLSSSLPFLVTIAYLSMSFGELMSIIYLLLLSRKKYSFAPLKKHQQAKFNHERSFKHFFTFNRITTLPLFYEFFRTHSFNQCFNSTRFNSKLHSGSIRYPFWLCCFPACHTNLFCTIIYRLYLPIATDDLYYHKSTAFLHLLYALLICLLIGLPFTLIFYFFPKQSLMVLYNTTSGYQQLKYMAFPFLLFYLQTPLSTILQAKNKNKVMFIISIIECTLEIILTYTLSHYLYVNAILISLFTGLITTLTLSAIYCFKIIIKDTSLSRSV